MKRYNKILIGLGLATMLFSSCHMEVEPTTSIAVDLEEENLINNLDELLKFDNGIYSAFRSTQYGAASMPIEVMCDGFNATTSYGNNYGNIHRTDNGFTSSDYEVEYIWQVNYSAIKDYNLFLEALSKYTPEDAEAEFYAEYGEAEAKFFRAYAYLTLVRAFAKDYNPNTAATDLGVPLLLTFDIDAKPERATVKKTYEQIYADAKDALDILESFGAYAGSAGETFVNVEAVKALLARYYLDTEQYELAAQYAGDIINTGVFEVSSDAGMMQDEYINDNGTEPILQLYASLNENGSGTNSYYTQWAYNSNYAGYNGTGFYFAPYYLPSGKLVDLYEDSDLRLSQWFTSYFRTGSRTPLIRIGGLNYCYVDVFTKYYGNPALRTSASSVPNARQAVKPLLIGEQYLIAAEAYYRLGDANSAADYLNELQELRGATATRATFQDIQDEWFKETVGEGLRMSCLKRWNEGFDGREGQYYCYYFGYINEGNSFDEKSFPASDYHWVWPIPAYELKVNSNLVQNSGYGRE